MADTTQAHLAERVAERLRGIGGLAAPELAPERDIRRLVRRDWSISASPAGRCIRKPGRRFPPMRSSARSRNLPIRTMPGIARRGDAAGGVSPTTDMRLSMPPRRGAPALLDAATSLAVPEAPRVQPLDMAAMEKAGLVVGHKVRTRISEEFRITVGHILRSMHANYSPGRGAPNVIMVTSARPGEGKSFSALNLAGSIAQHAQREVILVDVDAKQRSMSAQLGLAERPGLLDLSTNPSMRIEDVILRTVIPHLSVVTIGSGHSVWRGYLAHPSDDGVGRAHRPALSQCSGAAGCAALPVDSDPSTLAPFVGQIVMVVEAERTQRNEVVAALDLIKACPSVTLMLNKIRLTTSYTFGAYHYFGTYS